MFILHQVLMEDGGEEDEEEEGAEAQDELIAGCADHVLSVWRRAVSHCSRAWPHFSGALLRAVMAEMNVCSWAGSGGGSGREAEGKMWAKWALEIVGGGGAGKRARMRDETARLSAAAAADVAISWNGEESVFDAEQMLRREALTSPGPWSVHLLEKLGGVSNMPLALKMIEVARASGSDGMEVDQQLLGAEALEEVIEAWKEGGNGRRPDGEEGGGRWKRVVDWEPCSIGSVLGHVLEVELNAPAPISASSACAGPGTLSIGINSAHAGAAGDAVQVEEIEVEGEGEGAFGSRSGGRQQQQALGREGAPCSVGVAPFARERDAVIRGDADVLRKAAAAVKLLV